MLRFESLLVKNFGPFKGYQQADFPAGPGVVIVVGANMRGKTSFLNAIRFALFGATVNRAGKAHKLIHLINDEAKAEGDYQMRVALAFSYRQSSYRINRVVSPSDPERVPVSDADLKQELHLERDGAHLSKSDSERELLRILPPSLARFFLFDGELLQQYEELLSQSESVVRTELIESIEKILAVPVLLNARRHLQKLHGMAQRDLDQALQRDKRHDKLAQKSRELRIRVETLERDIEQSNTYLQGLNARVREINTELAENAELIDALKEQVRLEAEAERVSADVDRAKARVREALPQSWRDVSARVLAERAEVLQARKDELLRQLGGLQKSHERAESLRRALESAVCPTCGRPMQDPENRDELERELKALSINPEEVEILNQRVANVGSQINLLSRTKGSGDLRRAKDAQRELSGYLVDQDDVERRLHRVRAQIEGRDDKQVSDLQRELQQVNEARGVAKENSRKWTNDLEAAKSELQSLRSRIPREGESSLVELAMAKVNSTLHLQQLLDRSVGEFRDDLRKQVEKRSTDMFLALTSEPDYQGLRINENYGLEILRRSGDPVTIRSAGAEHIVAYSLIAALQSSSPRPGPVFVDSPFGRLDKVHSENVVKALPRFSEQVVLLVHENELDLDLARRLLSGSLLKEFELRRRSSTFTELVEK